MQGGRGTIYRAPTGICVRLVVFVDENDPMHVVRHDDERVHLCIRKMGRDILPTFLDDRSRRIDLHFAIHNFPKQKLPPEGDDGNVKSTRLGVIISFQADGLTLPVLNSVRILDLGINDCGHSSYCTICSLQAERNRHLGLHGDQPQAHRSGFAQGAGIPAAGRSHVLGYILGP